MKKECTENIVRIMELSRLMIQCADKGDNDREDDSCGVLFGIARDAAYRIMELAVAERLRHVKNGTWDEDVEREYVPYISPDAGRKEVPVNVE